MDQKTYDGLMQISVATVTMQLLKKGIRNTAMVGVRPLNLPHQKIVGPAYTLRFVPYREDLVSLEKLASLENAQRRAIEEATPGAVLVADGRGRADIAVLGDILIERLKVRGVAGLVTDGGIRDLQECQGSGFTMYGAGAAAPASLVGHAPAEVQCAIGCGGVAVIPGDVIVGDGDGIVVIPAALAAAVASDGIEQERFERYAKMKVAGGAPAYGTYPPNAQTKAAYQDWLKAGEPDL
ncbi:MAG: ribonuclease activity regulator RraA [Rhodospirillales bacterium]|nr:ribonuclease activity regulator RraA [Rhodospirillales bacterium]